MNDNKRHIFIIGARIQKFEYEMNGIKLRSVQCVKDLGITIPSSLKLFQQYKDAASKVNRMLGFISRNFFKGKDIILPISTKTPSGICCAALVASPCKG